MTSIDHEYHVSPKVAMLLKEAGFDWKCYTTYNLQDGNFDFRGCSDNWNVKLSRYASAPTLDVAERWLREVKNCYISVDVDYDLEGVFYTVKYVFHDGNKYKDSYIWEDTGLDIVKHRRVFENFEKAQEAGIKKALEIILEKGGKI